MKDSKKDVIYVGKAVNIRNRVKSYFSSQHQYSPKTRALVANIKDLEYIITDSEVEALILENNLIKQYRPKYNIRLTDDKNYPYLKVTIQEDFPRIEIVRAAKKDGARYFGPYPNSSAVHETLRVIKGVFPVRSCKQANFEKKKRPCLNAHIGRCKAPCIGGISKEEYKRIIDDLIMFLEGRQENLFRKLKRKMEEAVDNLEFEKAAEIRDQITAINKVTARQKIISERLIDFDIIDTARAEDSACVQIFFVRAGKLIGNNHFYLSGCGELQEQELISIFIKQYYGLTNNIPPEILVSQMPEDKDVLELWLTSVSRKRVSFKVPQRGYKHQLLVMVKENAAESLQQQIIAKKQQETRQMEAIEQLQLVLCLPKPPQRMECYDISNIQGSETVASMVVFENGRARRSEYRRFKIVSVEGPNDFASMAEVIHRRFLKSREGNEKFINLPDLVVIDGGRGQLSAARAEMKKLGYEGIPAVGLAKENEWIFKEDRPEPLVLSASSQALKLLQQIRDEAHRFAITYHRTLRGKRNLNSILDEIPGIGPQRRIKLLKHFAYSLQKIRTASIEELCQAEGINKDVAEKIWCYFHPEG